MPYALVKQGLIQPKHSRNAVPQIQCLLKYSGLYVEGMDSRVEDVAAMERRWLKPIYSAAPRLIVRHALKYSMQMYPVQKRHVA